MGKISNIKHIADADPFYRTEPIAYDGYQQRLTGGVTMTLTAARTDDHHIPCVIIEENNEIYTD